MSYMNVHITITCYIVRNWHLNYCLGNSNWLRS